MYHIPLSDFNEATSIADWVELMITINQTSMSKSQINSAINSSSGEEPSETIADDVWVELKRRENLYGNIPPYILEYNLITFSLDYKSNPEYVMCLLLSLFGNAQQPSSTGKLFERLSCEAISNYLNGNAVVFGHPSQMKVSDLTQLLHETIIRELPPTDKDGGLDVMAWIPFNDYRPSQLVILFQCAAGKNWETKLTHLTLDYWRTLISWKCLPCRGFTAPVVITDHDFDKKAYLGGVLLDRIRIYKNTYRKKFQGQLRSELLVWVNDRISELS